MEPATLSASAIKTFQDCEAGYKASYIDRIREPSGAPAELGTAVHDTCEWAVVNAKMDGDVEPLIKFFESEAARYGLDSTMKKDGRKMLKDWHERWQVNPPHEVLSCELKETFPIKSSDGTRSVGVTYIWDRGDRMADGSIDVVDYKTWRRVMDAEDMLRSEQVRIYALSAQLKYKGDEPPHIWVTLDQMRTGPVSVKFTREDNLATWHWLRNVFDRILASDGTSETINENCRYCPRKAQCATLDRATAAGNIAALRQNPEAAARRLAELKAAKPAMEATISELEEFMEELLEEHQVGTLQFPGVLVKMNIRKRRVPQMEMIAKVLGDEIMSRYPAKLSMGELDELLSGNLITDEQKREVSSYIDTQASGSASASFSKEKM